jgi:hypothetical protein
MPGRHFTHHRMATPPGSAVATLDKREKRQQGI